MNWVSLGNYLVGRRKGIEEIARCPNSLWLGLAFVLLAGIARDYDGEDLVAQPYWLIVPFVASSGTSLLLYGLAALIARPKPPEKAVSYQAVLSLYWLTAPMAWIYAIPVERWLDAGAAMSANLWLLKIVATWRVVLMVRVIAVLFRVSHFFAATLVLFFADSVVVIVSHLTPMPIWNVMGGVRLTESEQVLQEAMCATRVFSVLAWPILCLVLIIASVNRHRAMKAAAIVPDAVGTLPLESLPPEPNVPRTMHRSLWLGPVALGLLGAVLLAIGQPEQRLRTQVERLLLSDRLPEAIRLMSAHQRSDFPPHWDPPPRPAFELYVPSAPKLAELVLTEQDVAPWVVEETVEKCHRYLGSWFQSSQVLRSGSDDELQSILFVLERRPLLVEAEQGAICSSLRQRLDEASRPPELSLPTQKKVLEYLMTHCPSLPEKRDAVEANSATVAPADEGQNRADDRK